MDTGHEIMKLELADRQLLKKSPLETLGKILAEQHEAEICELLQHQGRELVNQLEIRDALTLEQKRTSRKIGAAKKQALDVTQLLFEINSISEKLKQTKANIEATIDKIDANLRSFNDTTIKPAELSIAENIPTHFRPQVTSSSTEVSELTLVENCPPEVWTNYVNLHPHATIYHEIRWQKLIENNFKHICYYLALKDKQGQIRGILPLVHLNSKLFGSFLVSMPYFNYGGPLADSDLIAEKLLKEASKLAGNLDCNHVEIRESKARKDWPVRTEKVSLTLPLPETQDSLLEQFGAKIRAQIKRPLQYNASITFATEENLDDFYYVFSRRMRSLGTPVYSKQFFSDILTTYPEHAFIAIVTVNGKPVAAGFLLGYRDSLEIPWAATTNNNKYPSINMFLYGNILKEAQRRQYEHFDFGRSTIDSATYRFKKQWGAQTQPLFWHYWLKNDSELPSMNPNNPKYRYAILAWQRMPLWLTQVLGPAIVKNLP